MRARLLEDLATTQIENKTNSIELMQKADFNRQHNFSYSSDTSGTRITGTILIPDKIMVTMQTPNIEIEHIFELYFIYKTAFGKRIQVLRAGIVIASDNQESLAKDDDNVIVEDEEEYGGEGVLIMPLSKFKLEEKYNLLSKTAALLQDGEY
jgi:hypothetical protein